MATYVPDKPGQLARDRNADLVVMQVPRAEAPVSLRKSQLRAPGDVADHLRLPLLALLEHNAHAGRKAIIPGRFD